MEVNSYQPTEKQNLAHSCPARYLLFGGAKGGGKGNSINSFVLTPFGFKKMGDIKVGNLVSNPDGSVSTVIAVNYLGNRDIYKFKFIDGAETKVTLDHLWLYHTVGRSRKVKGKRKSQWLINTTEHLINLLRNKNKCKRNVTPNILIPLCEPIQFTRRQKLRISPYILGALIGDGCLTQSSITFSSDDDYIVNKIKKEYEISKRKSKYSYGIKNCKKLKADLIYYKLFGHRAETKFIPEEYKFSDLKIRYEIIRGLFDTDGYIDNRGHVEFTTVSEQLAKGVQWIIRSLGGKATIATKIGKYKDVECQLVYRLYINIKEPYNLFSMPRKRKRGFIEYNNGAGNLCRRLTSIEYCGKEEAKCITVNNPNGLYITDDFIVTHNSVWGNEECVQLCMEHEGNRGFMGRKKGVDFKNTTLETFIRMIPKELYKHNIPKQVITFINGSKIFYGGLDSQETIEKFNSAEYGFFFIDQAEEIEKDQFAMLKATLRLRLPDGTFPRYRGLLTCNPRPGWLKAEFILKKQKGYAFIQALPSDNKYLPPDYINTLKEAYGHRKELLNSYLYGNWDELEGSDILMNSSDIEICVNRELNYPFNKVVVVCDPARFGDDSTITYVIGNHKIIEGVYKERQDTMQTAGELVSLARRYNADAIAVDSIGIGAGVCDRVRELGGKLVEINSAEKSSDPDKFINLRAEMWWNVAEKVKKHEVSILNDEELKTELGLVKYEFNGSKIKVTSKEDIKKELGRSCDKADAFVMGVYVMDMIPDTKAVGYNNGTPKWVEKRRLEAMGIGKEIPGVGYGEE